MVVVEGRSGYISAGGLRGEDMYREVPPVVDSVAYYQLEVRVFVRE